MLQHWVNYIGLQNIGIAGLFSFVAIFVGALIWTFTRSHGQIDHWSRLPVDDGSDNSQDGL